MTPIPALQLPKLVTQADLNKLAAPDETHEIHIIVRRIVNQAPYTLRGRLRQYIVQRDQKRGAHILRVPLSVWMAGCPINTVIQNDSICYDITSTRTFTKSPLTFEMWRIAGDKETAPVPTAEIPAEAREQFAAILDTLDAPEVVRQAFSLAANGDTASLADLHEDIKADIAKESERKPLTAAERQKKRRERLKAEKEAAKQLQPA